MKRAIIIHGWGVNPTKNWYQAEKKELEKRGYKVDVPVMPNVVLPDKNVWVKTLASLKPNENTVLIGHSLGARTILRYLEETNHKVETVILIAAFSRKLGITYEQPLVHFVSKPFNWKKISRNANKFVVINQFNDEWVPKERGMEIAEKTGAELILVKGTDHFTKMDLSLINDNL